VVRRTYRDLFRGRGGLFPNGPADRLHSTSVCCRCVE
jgi:hypothetical protein